MSTPRPRTAGTGIYTIVRVRVSDRTVEQAFLRSVEQAGCTVSSLQDRKFDCRFGLSSAALSFAQELSRAFGVGLQVGLASGESSGEGSRLEALAASALDAAEPGQVALCLATVELCRATSDGTARFVEIGTRSVGSTGERARIFLLDVQPDVPRYAAVAMAQGADCFIGRQRELGQISRMLDLSRLVTIVGRAGTGKSALVRRLGIELEQSFKDGVWIVDLSDLTDERQVVPHLCQALEVARGSFDSGADAVAASIGDKSGLLILDGCERWISPLGGIVPVLLNRCEHLQIVCSGLRRLRLRQEAVFQLSGLETPPEGIDPSFVHEFDSVGLFVERAEQVDPTFRLTDANSKWVAAICRRLGGIPLAIELAAAKVTVLSPKQIHDRLEHRFSLLKETKPGSRPKRHATLWNTVEWSASLLSPSSKILLRRLSVLKGAFTVDVATSVCTDEALPEEAVLPAFEEIRECSLLQPSTIEGDERFFYLAETVRMYAEQLLVDSNEKAAAVARKTAWAEKYGAAAMEGSAGEDEAQWLVRIDASYEDIREVVRTLLQKGEPERAARLAHACYPLWHHRSFHDDGIQILSEVLRHRKMAKLPCRPRYLNVLATLYIAKGKEREAHTAALRSARAARRNKDLFIEACARNTLGMIWFRRQEFARALPHYRRATAIFRDLGDRVRLLSTLANLLACFRGPVTEEERKGVQEGIELLRDQRNTYLEALFLNNLAERELDFGNAEKALPQAAKALLLTLQYQDPLFGQRITKTLVKALDGLGKYEEAMKWIGFTRTISEGMADPLYEGVDSIAEIRARIERDHGPQALEWYGFGTGMSLEDAIELVNSTL